MTEQLPLDAAPADAPAAEAPKQPPPAPLWTGGLLNLSATLQAEARETAPEWARYKLPRGAFVACRVHPAYHVLQFRISRKERPAPDRRDRWDLELKTFIRFLGLTQWDYADDETDDGIAAFFLEPAVQPSLPEVPIPLPAPLPADRAAQHERAREAMGG